MRWNLTLTIISQISCRISHFIPKNPVSKLILYENLKLLHWLETNYKRNIIYAKEIKIDAYISHCKYQFTIMHLILLIKISNFEASTKQRRISYIIFPNWAFKRILKNYQIIKNRLQEKFPGKWLSFCRKWSPFLLADDGW